MAGEAKRMRQTVFLKKQELLRAQEATNDVE
jgi:hypothetical protein